MKEVLIVEDNESAVDAVKAVEKTGVEFTLLEKEMPTVVGIEKQTV